MKQIKELQLIVGDTLTQMNQDELKKELNKSKKKLYTLSMKLAL